VLPLREVGPPKPGRQPPALPSPAAAQPLVSPLSPERRTLTVAGLTRTFQLVQPAKAGAKAPLWVVLHGSGGSGEDMRQMHGAAFDRSADEHGIVVAYPDGYGEHWNDCRPRADYAANLENVDDVGFLRALVASLEESEDIDTTQVTFIGISNGGHMVFRIAFEAPELGRAYVALLANLPAPGNDDCHHSGVPVPMLLINGSEDPINPAAGGVVSLAGNTSRGAVLSAADTATTFARWAGHLGPPEVRAWPDRAPADGTSIESSSWAAPGHPAVAWIRVIGGGHSVPTTAQLPAWPPEMQAYLLRVYGRQSVELETIDVLWSFSSSFGLGLL